MGITNFDVARGWLAAFIDGEGCVYSRNIKRPDGSVHSRRVVTIASTDKELIDTAAECFDLFEIAYGLSDRKGATATRKHIYTIEVRRAADMQRLRAEIPIQHKEKQRKLDEALSFVRGLCCKKCGCAHDLKTVGCIDCRKRHAMRAYAQKYRDGKKAAHACGTVEVSDECFAVVAGAEGGDAVEL